MEVIAAVVLITCMALLARLLQRRPSRHLPPSPFLSLPLLGHLFHLYHVRSPPFLEALCQKLGPMFTLYMGRIPIIFIASPSLAHKALVQDSLVFATRPLLPSRTLLANHFRNISSAPYGPHWRTLCRNLVHQMLSMHNILSFAPARARMLNTITSRILAEASDKVGVVSVCSNIRYAMFDVFSFMCFGFRMPEEMLLQLMAFNAERISFTHVNLQNFFPQVGVFSARRRQAERAVLEKQEKLYTSYFEKHRELQKWGELAPGSYFETLLHMNASTPLSTDDLAALCLEFLTASTDTTATALEWALAHLVESSSIQSRLYQQIQDAVGDRLVEEKDLPDLPYVQAVIKETLRLHPPADFLLPHAVAEHCRLGGYDIPPNAIVQFNVTSISRDAGIWEEPLTYKPERFLAAAVDVAGSGRDVKMLPFGAGRRVCPGATLAFMLMQLVVARLVQVFEWTNFPAGKPVDFTEAPVVTVKMKNPLQALVKERNSQ